MTTSPAGLLQNDVFHSEQLNASTKINVTIAGAQCAVPVPGSHFTLQRGGTVIRDKRGKLNGFGIKPNGKHGTVIRSECFIDKHGVVFAVDSPVWVAIFESLLQPTALIQLVNGHNPPQIRDKAIVILVANVHDVLLKPYEIIPGTRSCRFNIPPYIIGGWVPVDGTCVCGKHFNTIGDLMEHLNTEWSPFRGQGVSIHPRVQENSVLRPLTPGPTESPVFAVGQSIPAGTFIVHPPEFYIKEQRIRRRPSSTSTPTPSGTILALIQSPNDTVPRQCEVWDPARRCVTPSELRLGLASTEKKTRRQCVVCRAPAGSVCMDGCPNDAPCPNCTSPSIRACPIHPDASCECGMPCDIRKCRIFNL